MFKIYTCFVILCLCLSLVLCDLMKGDDAAASDCANLIDEIKELRSEIFKIRNEVTFARIWDTLDEKLFPIKSSINQLKADTISTKISVDEIKEEMKSSMMQLQQDVNSIKTSSILTKAGMTNCPIKSSIESHKEEMVSPTVQLKKEINLSQPTNFFMEEQLKTSEVLMKKKLDNITTIKKQKLKTKWGIPMNLKTGSECTWNGVKGTCIDSRRCLSTLDNTSEKIHPVCSMTEVDVVACCTDCVLVNDTRNAVINPGKGEGILWKDGRTARDYCLKNLAELPYKCHRSKSLERHFNEENKCYRYNTSGENDDSNLNLELLTEYPYQVVLGETLNVTSVNWRGQSGVIISERYILTSGLTGTKESIAHVYAGTRHRNEGSREGWQLREIKRRIVHPAYNSATANNDIALLEITEPWQFTERVLPACLPSDQLNDAEALHTTWRGNDGHYSRATILTIKLDKYKQEICSGYYGDYNDATQMCFGLRNSEHGPYNIYGDPLMVTNYISSCLFTVIGVDSYGPSIIKPVVYTRISYYIPWIESIVWP